MIRGGDAVGEELAVGVGEREPHVEENAGARHDLTFEGVAVKVHDSGRDQRAVEIDRGRRSFGQAANGAVLDGEFGAGHHARGRQNPAIHEAKAVHGRGV